ncbi:MAG TPA: bifunctional diguanylate cyclase/phosphodiesterase [Symbiobacteriaceae bacterium]|nr:bifunctional diguanylate cyclase/phosphodiesterase [Symbiobacteriaceae bacterium]
MKPRTAAGNPFRLMFMAGALEIGYGVAIYLDPTEMSIRPDYQVYAPWVAALLLAGGVVLLALARYRISPWLRRFLVILPVVPLVLLALGPEGSEEPIAWMFFMLLALGTASIPWLPDEMVDPDEARDLFETTMGVMNLLGGSVMLLAPSLYEQSLFGPVTAFIRPLGASCLYAAFGLLNGHRLRPRYPWLLVSARVAASLSPVAFGASMASNGRAGATVICTVVLLGLWSRPPRALARGADADDDSSLDARALTTVERAAEGWSWAVLPAVVLVAVLDDMTHVRMMIPVSQFVISQALYNILAHWIFPGAGALRHRVMAHLVAFVLGLAFLMPNESVIEHGVVVLLVIPPLLAARAYGERGGFAILGLEVLSVIVMELPEVLVAASASGEITVRLVRIVTVMVAGTMAVRSASAQRRLAGALEVATARLQDMNGKLAAQNEALTKTGAALERLANIDAVTDLINRRRFQEAVEMELTLACATGRQGALFYIDLDEFKVINDTLGHKAGDQVLQQVARVLEAQTGEGHLVGRLGGDEFAILAPGLGEAEARRLGERVLEGLRGHPAHVHGRPVTVSASVGITLYPADGSTLESLLINADTAMYQAKRGGRNALRLYQCCAPAVRTSEQEETNWDREIRAALHDDRFVFHYQPIVRLGSGRVDRYEALLRMVDRQGRIILPGAFLPAAEQSALIHEIDRWVVRRSLATLAKLQEMGGGVRLEVNLSGRAFDDEGLLPLVASLFRDGKADPSLLVFEITETAAISDLTRARRFIQTLRSMGCTFAIDDFGSGFSSFAYLRHLSVDYLKIDGSLIQQLTREPDHQHVVRGIADMARGLRMETIAEKAEDRETVQLLAQLGVDMAQGYTIGRPSPDAPFAMLRLK